MPWRSRRAKAPQRKPNSPSAGIGTVSTPPPQQQDTLPPRIGVSTIQTERRHPPPLAQYSTQVGLADSCSLSPVRNDLRWLTISPDIAVVSHGGEGWGEGSSHEGRPLMAESAFHQRFSGKTPLLVRQHRLRRAPPPHPPPPPPPPPTPGRQ